MWGKRRNNINCYRKDSCLDLDTSMNEIPKTTDRSLPKVGAKTSWNTGKEYYKLHLIE